MLGRSMSGGEGDSGNAAPVRKVEDPGPIVSIGEFTSNLAGAGRHVISFAVSLEVLPAEELAPLIQNPGWLLRIRNEVLLLAKDKVYDDLTNAEGTLQFANDIKRVINSILPDVKGEAPVVQVLFESFVLQ